MKVRESIGVACVAVACLITLFSSAQAQSVEEFYKSTPIKLVVGNGAGGDYDATARMVARYLPKHLPGKPTIIVQNMPGANGVTAANYLYSIAPKDGSVIGSFSRNIPTLDALRRSALQADTRRFGWLAGIGEERRVCFASSKSPIKNAKDLFDKELTVGGTAATASLSITPVALNKVLGTKFHVIEGYRGTPEVIIALTRGEVEGICHTWALFKSQHADLMKSGIARPVIHMEEDEFPDIPGLPSAFDYANEDQKEYLRFIFSNVGFGVPYVAPPDIPADRLTALRAGFAAMVKDSEFLAEAEKMDRDTTFHNPDQLLTLVNQLRSISPEKLKQLEAILPNMFN
jgi:tripartite-type tricarboxylate transporter receptor subunit TctC